MKEETKCKYCSTNRILLNETAEYSDIEIMLLGNLLRVRSGIASRPSGFESQDAITINYCPFCGRKLSEKFVVFDENNTF